MVLTPGQRLGAYAIVSPLGAGGMGEVWRATDTRLGRDVALKLLPAAFSSDPDRLARFEREAKLLAALSHTHIAGLFALEEATVDGTATQVRFLAMELAEGEDLAERLKRGAIPVDEAIAIAKQIAEALEAAHEKGIVHRDLKPANVKVSADGHVKVLDFGLAKAWSGDGDSAMGSADGSLSPTLARTGTAAGLILGTAAYMSPEQARGKPVDKRADIWAFGVVLFEMLAGKRLFEGETVSDTLAAVLRQEIDWERLPASTPASVRRLLERCLDRDPKQRLRDIGEARIAIEAREDLAAQPAASPVPLWRRALPWVAGCVLGAAAVLSFWAPWRSSPRAAPVRLSAELGADVSLATRPGVAAVLSPDGARLAFVATKSTGGQRQLYVRRLDELAATPLAGTEGAWGPFFSPNGEWIAFFTFKELKKVSVTGGAAVTLCDLQSGSGSIGGTWAEDGTVVFQPSGGPGVPLHRVSSAGGTPEPVTTLAPREVIQRWPQLLPGGEALLYTSHDSQRGYDRANLVVQPLPTGARKVVLKGGYHGRYLASGHLAYIRGFTLFVAPFDLDRLEVKGPSVPALEGVSADPLGSGSAQFAFSGTGTLAYVPGRGDIFNAPIHWMGREGKTTPLLAAPSYWGNPAFSPDGRRLAVQINDGKQDDVWIYEWGRGTLTRLTLDAADDGWPVWAPDGRRIAFSSTRAGNAIFNLYWQRVDGTGEVERLTESQNMQWATSFHPGGKLLAFSEYEPADFDVMILPIEGDEASGWKPGKPTSFPSDASLNYAPMFSPDGRWLAYTSNETGRPEVYVRPFPGPGGKSPISTLGMYPTWSRTRRELFFSTFDQSFSHFRIMVAPYTVEGDSFVAEKPRLWSEGSFGRPRGIEWRPYDLHPDGERFALAPPAETEGVKQDKLVIVFNFFDELRRIAPVQRAMTLTQGRASAPTRCAP